LAATWQPNQRLSVRSAFTGPAGAAALHDVGRLALRSEFHLLVERRTGERYAVGQAQRIGIRVGFPLNSFDGGTGGVQGAWNGKVAQYRRRRPARRPELGHERHNAGM